MEMHRTSTSLPVVIVTGANQGIGFAIVDSLVKQRKYFISGFDVLTENLDTLARDHEGLVLPIHCDITNEEEVNKAVSRVADTWGRIDVLVNNACICPPDPFESKTVNAFLHEFDVNFLGYVRVIHAVLPHMKSQKTGGIIHNVSSGVGLTGYAGISGYVASKGAIEALTKTLALELRKYNIHVTTMHPPLTRTNSASALGLPQEAMADPGKVGKKLAGKISSRGPVVTPDLQTRVFVAMSRVFPGVVGRMLNKLTERAHKQASSQR